MSEKISSIRVDGYNSGPYGADTDPPAAAIFNRGAKNIAEIQKSIDARREHSRRITNLRGDPNK